VLARPATHIVLTLLFGVIGVCVVLFLFEFSVTRKTHVVGVLLPRQGVLNIQSPQAGVIREARVQEGQRVKASDVLYVISSDRISTGQDSAGITTSRLIEIRLQSIQRDQAEQQSQAELRIAAAQARSNDLAAELAKIEQQRAMQRRRIALVAEIVKRDSELRAANFISSAIAQQHEGDLLDQEQRLADLERLEAATNRDLAAVHAEASNAQIQARRDQESAGRAIAELQQELAENEVRREILIRAPRAGTVTAVSAVAGSTISSGQVLASILPADSPLEAELYAPSRAVGFIKPGMKVLLRYQAFPYQKFGQFAGFIREVSGAPVASSSTSQPPNSEPIYRVRVTLDSQTAFVYGEHRQLTPGMALEASVVLERRRLYEWILEPLYSIRGRV